MRRLSWPIPYLSTKDRALVVLCSMVLSLLMIGVGWIKGKRVVHRKLLAGIQLVEKRTGWPVEVGSWQLGPGFVTLEEVRMGPEGNLLLSEVRVMPGLNPFSRDFGRPTHITIGNLRFKARADLLRSLHRQGNAEPTKSRGDPQNRDSPPEAETLITEAIRSSPLASLFRSLPASRMDIKGAGVNILSDDGTPLLTVKGLRLRAHKRERKILVRTESIGFKDFPPEPRVEGRISLTPQGHYRFFVRRRAETTKKGPLWLLSGSSDKTLDHLQVFVSTKELPIFLMEQVSKILGPGHKIVTSSRIKATRDEDGWRFALRSRSKDISFLAPMIAKETIGPVQFELTARGAYSAAARELTLEKASLALPRREDRTHGDSSLGKETVQLSLKGSSTLSMDDGFGMRLALAFDLPPTSCQSLLNVAPTGLIPKIEDFKVTGLVSGRLKLVFDTRHPESADVSPEDTNWNCSVEAEPERYAVEKLKQPFMLEKTDDATDETLTRVLSPTNPNFRSLKEMSASVPLAFVASEDASFFAHKGIDTSAIEGAFKRNITEGRIAVGGSTITMQTAKNLFLSNERTISRKLQELFFAWHMERVLTKERILEIYLNIVEFGPGIFGITHAAKHYFDKEPANLNLTEAAYLASLLPSPKSRYLSFCRGHITPGLSNILSGLLRRMLNLGRISADRFEAASAGGLHFNEEARLSSTACSSFGQREQAQN